jgi:hypothetical protein
MNQNQNTYIPARMKIREREKIIKLRNPRRTSVCVCNHPKRILRKERKKNENA